MPERTNYEPGTFCWVDLATPDIGSSKQFYTGLFGWTMTDVPAGEAGAYTMAEQDGKTVCGLYALCEEDQKKGISPHRQSYVSVGSADRSAAMVTELGGKVLLSPFDVMDVGRTAVVQDPSGATFSLWEPREHRGAALVNVPNALCWNELQTSDTSAAGAFYGKLFGWTSETSPGAAGEDYTEFKNGDRLAGGMLRIQEAWGPVPPNWAVYFAVADCDAALETARRLGGQAKMPPVDTDGVGRFVFLQDPQGASFAVVQLLAPDD